MPKPVTAFTWATDVNFSSGPASGNPTKVNPPGWPAVTQGSVPDLTVVAEFYNTLFNHLGEWIAWVNEGKSSGGADAHIVETDAFGTTTITGNLNTNSIIAGDEVNITADLVVQGGGGITQLGNGPFETDAPTITLADNIDHEILCNKYTGTGANDGTLFELRGSDGQNQTGGADNNSGGVIEVHPGEPGVNGSGANGGIGMTLFKSGNGSGAPGAGAGYYVGVADMFIPGSGGVQTVNTGPVFLAITTALVVVTCVYRSSATKRAIFRRRYIVDVNGSLNLTPISTIDTPISHNAGYAGMPSVILGSFLGTQGRLGVTITGPADVEGLETTVTIEIHQGKQA